MKSVSIAYAEITNLVNMAKWHKEHCHESCNVSLNMVRSVCMKMIDDCWDDEQTSALNYIDDTLDWS